MPQNLDVNALFLKFRLLSMTELRTRPGDVLDRVADAGEAFIIERNGQQKACLVPLSVFLPDISPDRLAEEFEELVGKGEQPKTSFSDTREVAFRFLDHLSDNAPVEVKILLPHGYPNSCPRVYASPVSTDAPHRWRDGALCLYGVTVAWNPGRHTVYSTLQLARQWLAHYDTWRQSGTWPKAD
jgi:antitoxin (DNA-binding transcriptional repressor) of toxin-antitoxin stability system